MAVFLVDLWCMGLKGAFGQPSLTLSEFQDRVLNRPEQDSELERIDAGTARRIVAGGIRFAQQNGFRLPARYERWLPVLGDIGDWQKADLSDFGVEGGRLRFVGSLDQLRQRLVGCSLSDFIARPDVEFISEFAEELGYTPPDPDTEEEMTEDEEDEFEAVLNGASDLLTERHVRAIRKWCFANNIVPSSRLDEAVRILLGFAARNAPSGLDDEPGSGQRDSALPSIEWLLDEYRSQPDLIAAFEQFRQYTGQYSSPEEALAALGFNPDEFDD